MKLSDITKEELETMNYDDIAYIILNEEKAKMKINVLFKRVCEALELNENEFEDKIADFFELLTTDKRFIMLEDGSWDLKELHNPKVIIEEEEDDTPIEIEENEDNIIEEEENEDNIFYDSDNDDDLPDDDLEDLVVIDVDDEEANS
ncbi:MAG: DNA-directed RNA polymerase subunit delta [Bacilli bacterium]|jgi:DNA-directed RNA polymerase subunit delta|nr:DNA-directed RNA polymerase subunit delta [Bacilli bacterium]MCX4254007.1 DNA-directed RNA polymerase subunit delta [Bacilli bacterium]